MSLAPCVRCDVRLADLQVGELYLSLAGSVNADGKELAAGEGAGSGYFSESRRQFQLHFLTRPRRLN